MRAEYNGETMLFGIEYDTDFYPSVLLIPVSPETANNVLSQIEKDDMENGETSTGGYRKETSPSEF